MLEELRFLLNFNVDSESPLALILSGQGELDDMLRRQIFRAIAQRVNTWTRGRQNSDIEAVSIRSSRKSRNITPINILKSY
jgi:type II secretory pathway predicted ATPase ExeA